MFESLFGLLGYQKKSTVIEKRGYTAAEKKARYGDFKASRGSADYELRGGLAVVRAKSRALARNSSSMRRFLWLMKINVVGSQGYVFKSRVRRADGSMDQTLNERAEDAWKTWCETPTVDGEMHMVDLQVQVLQSWCRDGEAFIELVRNSTYRDGFALNPLEADFVDETHNTINLENGNEIRMGVEINRLGRPVAYYVLEYHPGSYHQTGLFKGRMHRRVPAENMIHIFERTRSGQTRGEPHGSSVINPVKMLDGYREAETMRRRVMAAIGGFFSRTMPKLEGVSELADQVDDDDDVYEVNLEPGTFKQLPDGMDFHKFDPGGALTDYAQFESQIKKDICMGFNLSAFALGMETEGVSYSTGRSVLVEDRDFYRYMQNFFIRKAIKKIFNLWLSMHLLSVDSEIPPTRAEIIRKRCIFRGRGWTWVDPLKEVKANSEALNTSQISLAQIAADRGLDRDELLDEIKEDQEAAELRGLTLNYGNATDSKLNGVLETDDNSSD